jgi:hypothetical protein
VNGEVIDVSWKLVIMAAHFEQPENPIGRKNLYRSESDRNMHIVSSETTWLRSGVASSTRAKTQQSFNPFKSDRGDSLTSFQTPFELGEYLDRQPPSSNSEHIERNTHLDRRYW